MSMSKIALLACGLTVALATMAPAQPEYGELEIRERALMYFNPTTGKMQTMRIGTKGHDTIMKEPRPLPDGVFIYRSGGKLYMLDNKTMASGQMMLDIAKGLAE
jgi:hypothetical protein